MVEGFFFMLKDISMIDSKIPVMDKNVSIVFLSVKIQKNIFIFILSRTKFQHF